MEVFAAFLAILVTIALWVAERVGRVSAERELAEARRRAVGPYFRPYDKRFNSLEGLRLHPLWSGLLCYAREEVGADITSGETVYLVLENLGSACHEIRITLGKDGLETGNATTDGYETVFLLGYRFDPARKGQREEITVDFLANDGVVARHKYAMAHGQRRFRRIDPPGLEAL